MKPKRKSEMAVVPNMRQYYEVIVVTLIRQFKFQLFKV